MTAATQQVSLLPMGMCKNSLGPWAFDWGPRTPVMRNWASGTFCPSIAMKGMVPPSPMLMAGSPKKAREALSLAAASQGFLYAVTMTGTTGKNVSAPQEIAAYLERVRSVATVPVCAGFGIRSREQIERLRGLVDGVIIGSALVEVLERGESPQEFLAALRPRPRRGSAP